MSIKQIIASQVVDQFEIEPGWREGMEIPLCLTPEERWEILRDTKAFKKAIAEKTESEDQDEPVIGLELSARGGLIVKIKAKTALWRFKK